MEKHKIIYMLREAYHRLGVNSVRRLDALTQKAWDYLQADREYYIRVSDTDELDPFPEDEENIICKLVPLAQKVIEDKEEDHVRVHTAILYLMVCDQRYDLVMGYSYNRQYPDPSQNTYGFPVYRYASPQDILPGLKVRHPQDIRPAATKLDWEAYGMIFSAYARLEKSGVAEYIPLKTERAMLAYERTEETSLMVDELYVTGKPVLLAAGSVSPRQYRSNHSYSSRKELYLLISQNPPRYLLKTRHYYHYFRKVVYDDAPGGCAYEPTEEKTQDEYQFITLDEIPQDMRAHY